MRPQINKTIDLKHQTEYTLALEGEYKDYAFSEVRAPLNKGKWRSEIFKINQDAIIDLEVGTGNGKHFAHYALTNKDRNLVGIEIKYKPLIQSIRRVLKENGKNARICRYHAFNIDELFAANELNNIFIHFPDPWVSPRKPKNRFVSKKNLDILYELQRANSAIEFKTDSLEYFNWSLDEIKNTKYKIEFHTYDLHNSEIAHTNFITEFERIFTNQGIKINYIKLRK